MTYDAEGPDPVAKRSVTKPIRTAIVLGLLAVAVVFAGRWGWDQLTQPFDEGSAVAISTAEATPSCTPAPEAAAALPEPAEIRVNVYNSSGISGIAGQTSEQLGAQGFEIGAVDNDPLGKRLDGVGEIRSSGNVEPRVQQLLRDVPGATLVQDNRPDESLDFAVGAQFSGVGTPEPLPEQPTENTEDDIPTC